MALQPTSFQSAVAGHSFEGVRCFIALLPRSESSTLATQDRGDGRDRRERWQSRRRGLRQAQFTPSASHPAALLSSSRAIDFHRPCNHTRQLQLAPASKLGGAKPAQAWSHAPTRLPRRRGFVPARSPPEPFENLGPQGMQIGASLPASPRQRYMGNIRQRENGRAG